MGTGVSIFFMALGAILSLSVNTEVDWFNINTNTGGFILMGVGALGLLVTTLIVGDRGGHTTTTHEHHHVRPRTEVGRRSR